MKLTVSLIAFLIACALPAHAQTQTKAQTQAQAQAQAQVSENTRKFIEKAGVSNLYEIESSELALKQAQDPEVREFAQRMVTDHSNVGKQLSDAINQAGLTVVIPENLDERHREKLDRLQQASGREFDRAYLDQQQQAHEKSIKLYSEYSENGDVPALRQYASTALPSLREHMRELESITQTGNN